jgi:hypothetical protein
VPYRLNKVEKAETARLLGNARARPEQGDHVDGEHGRGSCGVGLALGACTLGRGTPGHHHGAASGPGVLAAVLTKMEVTTRLAC